jgi:hypothetical protein
MIYRFQKPVDDKYYIKNIYTIIMAQKHLELVKTGITLLDEIMTQVKDYDKFLNEDIRNEITSSAEIQNNEKIETDISHRLDYLFNVLSGKLNEYYQDPTQTLSTMRMRNVLEILSRGINYKLTSTDSTTFSRSHKLSKVVVDKSFKTFEIDNKEYQIKKADEYDTEQYELYEENDPSELILSDIDNEHKKHQNLVSRIEMIKSHAQNIKRSIETDINRTQSS